MTINNWWPLFMPLPMFLVFFIIWLCLRRNARRRAVESQLATAPVYPTEGRATATSVVKDSRTVMELFNTQEQVQGTDSLDKYGL